MPSAIEFAKQIANRLSKKYPAYSFRAVAEKGHLTFIELEVWRNDTKAYLGSDVRTERFYSVLTAQTVAELVTSITEILPRPRKKHG